MDASTQPTSIRAGEPPLSLRARVAKSYSEPWLGPHFYWDLIRLARKGWPTLARVLYLVALLVALMVMYRTQDTGLNLRQLSEYAVRAQGYAHTLIILQDLLVLVLLPVYVASAIVQEKENQTLEALTLTHLTDRELVLGKLGARLMHLGAVVLSSLPILAFLHLWGNVDINMLLYFETHTFLLLLTAGSVCIWVSTRAESVFQAISGSYPWLALIGFVSIISALVLPWIPSFIAHLGTGGRGQLTPAYLWMLLVVFPLHVVLAVWTLKDAIHRMEYLRRSERRNPRKSTGAMALADNPQPVSIPGKRGEVRSKIHPLAWPVRDDALFWKECIKDGTSWSLTFRWIFYGLGMVLITATAYRILFSIVGQTGRRDLPIFAYDFSFTSYFVSLAAYALAVVFQMTMSVAGEREQGTLVTLLMVPADRRAILTAKWLGPWVRNWPILAIAYLGALLGFACGLYGPGEMLMLILLPWPVMLFVAGLALWLSVMCRRVLFANMALVGVLGVLFIGHVAASEQTRTVMAYYIALFGNVAWKDISRVPWLHACLLAFGQQSVFLALAGLCVWGSFKSFSKRDYASG